MLRREFTATGTVTIAATVLKTIEHLDRLGVFNVEVVNNSGTVTLDQFIVALKDHPDGEWYTYLSATDFDANFLDFDADVKPPWLLFTQSTGPHELGPAGKAHFIFDAHRAYGVRFSAACVGAGAEVASVTVRGSY